MHEIGHNQGAHHDRANVEGRVPFPYGYGNCHPSRRWATVMAYVGINNNCSTRAPYFSSPALRFGGVPTGVANSMDNRRVLLETARIVANHRQSTSSGGGAHLLPYFLARRTPGRQGFVRIVNRSDRSGTVTVTAIDDEGRNAGTETLDLDAGGALHFNSDELERGDRGKGLSGVGSGTRHWRLLVASELDIQPLAYVRTDDGFVTRMDEVEEKLEGSGNRYIAHFTNPGRNRNQRSYLRLINPGSAAADVTIRAHDDRGNQRGPVSLSLPAGHARHVTASDSRIGARSQWPARNRRREMAARGECDPTGPRDESARHAHRPPHEPLRRIRDHGYGGPPHRHRPTTTAIPGPPPRSCRRLRPRAGAWSRAATRTTSASIWAREAVCRCGRREAPTTFGTLLRGGSVIGSNDDDGADINFRLTVPQAQAGTWYVEVKGYDSATTGDYALEVEFSGASSGSDIELTVVDQCPDGEDIQYRFFEFVSRSSTRPAGVWPGGDRVYVTRGYSLRTTSRLRCTAGRLVCYGGESRTTQRIYWGIGIDGDKSCSQCCVTCRSGVNTGWSLTCSSNDSTPVPPEGPAGKAPESVPLRR